MNSGALRPLFDPNGIILVGVGRKQESIGRKLLRNITTSGYSKAIHIIHPSADVIDGYPVISDLSNLPYGVDLLAVITPPQDVALTIEKFAQAGGRAVVVFSAGFAEAGSEGKRLQVVVEESVRKHGLLLVGPNCLGIANTSLDVGLNLTFSPVQITPGGVGVITQSGALGIMMLESLHNRGEGISRFVSLGNRVGVDEVDLLGEWRNEDEVTSFLIYLEAPARGRAFIEEIASITKNKRVDILIGGRTAQGGAATLSHTAAMASDPSTLISLLKNAGAVIHTSLELNGMEEVPPTIGREGHSCFVRILTNSGGPAVLLTDALSQHGHTVANVPSEVVEKMGELAPKAATFSPLVDLTAGVRPKRFGDIFCLMLEDDAETPIIVSWLPPLGTKPSVIAAEIAQHLDDQHNPPLIVWPLLKEGREDVSEILSQKGVIVASTIGDVVDAVWEMTMGGAGNESSSFRPRITSAHTRNKALPSNTHAQTPIHSPTKTHLLHPIEVHNLLSRYGINEHKHRFLPVKESEELIENSAAPTIQINEVPLDYFPVALKCFGPNIVHKRERGAVKLGIHTPKMLKAESAAMLESFQNEMVWGCLVQPMVDGDMELVVGASRHPEYGPILMVGEGGSGVEEAANVAWFPIPSSLDMVKKGLGRLPFFQNLLDTKSSYHHLTTSFMELTLKVQSVIENEPQIVEIDLNPVILSTAEPSLSIVDSRLVVTDEYPLNKQG